MPGSESKPLPPLKENDTINTNVEKMNSLIMLTKTAKRNIVNPPLPSAVYHGDVKMYRRDETNTKIGPRR